MADVSKAGNKKQLQNRKKSAQKAVRSSARKRVYNIRRKSALKAAVKEAKVAPSATSLSAAYQAIDKAARHHVIARAAAARMKSGLAKLLAKK
jgi:ribosomal protein S20